MTRGESVMFDMHPLVAAVMADRQREIERNVRLRRMLEASDSQDHAATKPAIGTGEMPTVRPIARRSAGPNGPACEAL
jgi:hypothetical protein